MKKTVSVLIVSALFVLSAFFILASSGDSGNIVSTPSIGPHNMGNLPGTSYVFNMTTEDSDFLWYSQPGGGGPAGGNGSMFGTWSGTPYGNGTSTSFGYVNLGGSDDFGPMIVSASATVITTEFEINQNEYTSPVSYLESSSGHYVLSPTSVLAPFNTLGMPTYELISGYLNFSGMPSAANYTGGFLLQVQYVQVNGPVPPMMQQNMPVSHHPLPPPPAPPGPMRGPLAQGNAFTNIISAYPYTVYSSTYRYLVLAFNVYAQNPNGVTYNRQYYQFSQELNRILPDAGIVYFDSSVQNLTSAVMDLPSGSTIVMEPGTYQINAPIIITHSLTITSEFTGPGEMATLVAPKIQSIGGEQPRSIFQIGGTNDPNINAGFGVSTPVTIQFLHFKGAGVEVPGTGASYLTLSDNVFTNMYKEAIGYHGNFFESGQFGTHLLISGNHVNGAGMPSVSDGIFIGNAFNSTIQGNYIIDTGWAGIILTGASQGDEGYNMVYNNYVSYVPHEGIQVAFGTHDAIVHNVVTFAGEAASVSGRDAAIAVFNPDQNNLTISGNLLENSFEGVGFDQSGTGSSSNPMGTDISIHFNDLLHNSVDVYNGATGTLDAKLNYWGSPLGPTTGMISGNVSYNPWQRVPIMGELGPGVGFFLIPPGPSSPFM